MLTKWAHARWDDWRFFITAMECFVWHSKCHTKINLPYYRYYITMTGKQSCTSVFFPLQHMNIILTDCSTQSPVCTDKQVANTCTLQFNQVI